MLGWWSTLGPWTRDHVLGQFWKLGFFLVRECGFFSHRGQIFKFIDQELMASIPTWKWLKITCMTHQNPFLMHDFHSMPRVGIQQVSLKSCSKWDSTCHRIMTVAWIDELSALLDLGHLYSARVAL